MNIRTAFAALGLLLLMAGSASAGLDCKQTAIYDASTNGATKLVTGAAAKRIYVCGYNIVGGGTASAGFVVGTGTNCATSQASLTPQYSMVAQSAVADSSDTWRGLQVDPGIDLCFKSSAGVAMQAIIFYTQQ